MWKKVVIRYNTVSSTADYGGLYLLEFHFQFTLILVEGLVKFIGGIVVPKGLSYNAGNQSQKLAW